MALGLCLGPKEWPNVYNEGVSFRQDLLVDEQITKMYSQVIQACFILTESSVTVIGINKT